MKVYEAITPGLADWIMAQPVFFNATAPQTTAGHINLSPRGLDSFRIINPNQVIILDYTGSGNETAAHLLDNSPITIMFCAFSGEPMILRLYGQGEAILPDHGDWDDLISYFPAAGAGVRQIFRVDVDRVQTSCGFGVPLMEFVGHRDDLTNWAEKKGPQGILDYQARNNQTSIDGLASPLKRG